MSAIFTPLQQTSAASDVILVLGPADQSRLELARNMMEAGASDNLVISAPDRSDPVSKSQIDLCVTPQEFSVWCQRSDPFTTQGEVSALDSLAQEHGWTSITIITERTHASRARLYANRCFSGSSVVHYVDEPLSADQIAYEYAYETAAFAKALVVTTGCA